MEDENISFEQALMNKRNASTEDSGENTELDTTVETQNENTEIETTTQEVEGAQEETQAETPEAKTQSYEGWYSPEDFEVKKAEWFEKNKVETPTYSERAKKLIELDNAGIDINETVVKYSNADFDSVDLTDAGNAIDVLEQVLKDVDGFSQEQVDFLIQKDYGLLFKEIDEDNYDEVTKHQEQIMSAQIEAKRALPKLKDFQQKVMLPPKQEIKVDNKPTAEQIEAQRQQMESYTANASKALNDFKSLDFNLGEDVNISLAATQENMGDVTSLVLDPMKQQSYFADNYLKEGEIDFQSLIRDRWIVKNFDTIVKELAVQYKAIGKDEILSDSGLSPDLTKNKQKAQTTSLTPMEQWKKNQNRE